MPVVLGHQPDDEPFRQRAVGPELVLEPGVTVCGLVGELQTVAFGDVDPAPGLGERPCFPKLSPLAGRPEVHVALR